MVAKLKIIFKRLALYNHHINNSATGNVDLLKSSIFRKQARPRFGFKPADYPIKS